MLSGGCCAELMAKMQGQPLTFWKQQRPRNQSYSLTALLSGLHHPYSLIAFSREKREEKSGYMHDIQ